MSYLIVMAQFLLPLAACLIVLVATAAATFRLVDAKKPQLNGSATFALCNATAMCLLGAGAYLGTFWLVTS